MFEDVVALMLSLLKRLKLFRIVNDALIISK